MYEKRRGSARAYTDGQVAENKAAEQAYNEGQKPLNKTIYTQAGFDAKPFAKDFADWQKRFIKDAEAFDVKMRKDKEYGRKIVEDKNHDALTQAFANSIDSGKKGLSLRAELISAYYAPAGHEGTEVTPSGMVFSKLVLNKNTKPVGYGGRFSDEDADGKKANVELWYMVFDDMTDWTTSDFNESLIFESFARVTNQDAVDESKFAAVAFAAATAAGKVDEAATLAEKIDVKPVITKAELPPYKTIKRNSWPALVFTRDADGKIKLYGMSMEMAEILGHIWNKQLF